MLTPACWVEDFPSCVVGSVDSLDTFDWLVAPTSYGSSTDRHVRHDVMTVGYSEVSSFEVFVHLNRKEVVPNPWLSVGVEQR